ERVRQLEARFAGLVARTRPTLPATALALIADAAPAGCAGLALLLSRRGVAAHAFDPRGALRAAELASLPCDLVVRTEMVLSPADVALARRVATIARRLVVHHRATTTTAVAAVARAS